MAHSRSWLVYLIKKMSPYPTPKRTPSKKRRTLTLKKKASKSKKTVRRRNNKKQKRTKRGTKGWSKVRVGLGSSGAIVNYESGGVLITPYCVHVGHTTNARLQMVSSIAKAIVKKMAINMKRPIEGFENEIQRVNIGDEFRLVYRQLGTDAPALPGNALVYATVAGSTWLMVADALSNFMLGLNDQMEFVEFIMQSTAGDTNYWAIPLNQCRVRGYVNSELKLQNQSVPAAGDDTHDEVDAIALTGRAYEGKGTGTAKLKKLSVYTADTSLLADQTKGLITRLDTTVQAITEPGNGYEYVNVKRTAKIGMLPGETKISKLNVKFNLSLNEYWNKYGNDTIAGLNRYQSPFGKFRFFALEKLIETSVGAPAANIAIAYEHNVRIGMAVSAKNSTKTEIYSYNLV